MVKLNAAAVITYRGSTQKTAAPAAAAAVYKKYKRYTCFIMNFKSVTK